MYVPNVCACFWLPRDPRERHFGRFPTFKSDKSQENSCLHPTLNMRTTRGQHGNAYRWRCVPALLNSDVLGAREWMGGAPVIFRVDGSRCLHHYTAPREATTPLVPLTVDSLEVLRSTPALLPL